MITDIFTTRFFEEVIAPLVVDTLLEELVAVTNGNVGVTSALIITKTVVLSLGGVITYFSYKAYRRTDAGPLRALAIGFGIITLGSMLGGVVHTVLNISLEYGVLINSIVSAIGFAVILYSLYTD